VERFAFEKRVLSLSYALVRDIGSAALSVIRNDRLEIHDTTRFRPTEGAEEAVENAKTVVDIEEAASAQAANQSLPGEGLVSDEARKRFAQAERVRGNLELDGESLTRR
jgi:hypothetical protein